MVFEVVCFFFFNDTATTEIYTLSLHDALPISRCCGTSCATSSTRSSSSGCHTCASRARRWRCWACCTRRTSSSPGRMSGRRSEEHTSELQSRQYLVCRLLLEKKKTYTLKNIYP